MSDINQDDIDKLLRENLAQDGAGISPPAPSKPEEERGPASQDDIDALFAAVSSDAPAAPVAKAAPAPVPAAKPAVPAEKSGGDDPGGVVNQDDIEALFAAASGTSAAAAPAPAPKPEPKPKPSPQASAPAAEPDTEGVANQDDIDALFSAVARSTNPSEADTVVKVRDDGDSPEQMAHSLNQAEAAADSETDEANASASAEDMEELDALLSSIAEENGADEAPEGEGAAHHAEPSGDSTAVVAAAEDVDLDELLREVSAAAPPPPPKPLTRAGAMKPSQTTAETTILDTDHVSRALMLEAGQLPSMPQHSVAAPPPPPPSPHPSLSVPPVPPAAAAAAAAAMAASGSGVRREYSVLYGAGEVDSVANQIAALLASMSEKAQGYMQAWIAADSEAKELRTRALGEERRRISLEGEKAAVAKQLDELRLRLSEVEGEKIAGEEARRTLETTFHAKIRELESQTHLLTAEAETLKEELTRARNQSTGVDIESRRVRFEAERLRNEVEAERMERLRIQRALENREKELQAAQAQSSGQASSLFLDELHRLVRRLESELESRTSGAHEALRQLDRLELPESMVPAVSNLRAALMQAMGTEADQGDALRNLGREASGVRGGAAVAPGKTEMLSFETAISTYNLTDAIELAGGLLREARATTGVLMRKIYQCPALRRPEATDKLSELARLLEGLRTVQEANDRSRGSETAESEIFYVQMFDFLHNLVCLKLINRLSGDIWRLFLDLRGRFSFVASDKQWTEYRDRILGDKKSDGRR